jgi:hypothetical protein
MNPVKETGGAPPLAPPEGVGGQGVGGQVNASDSNGFISSDLGPGQLPEAEQKPLNSRLVKKILGKVSTALSALGVLGSIVSGVIAVCVLAGACCTPAGAIIGAIAAVVSLVGIVCDVVNKATDANEYSSGRNVALGTQVAGYAIKIAAGVFSNFPIVNIAAGLLSLCSLVGSAISLCGFGAELSSDYRCKRLREEYGPWLGSTLEKILSNLVALPPASSAKDESREGLTADSPDLSAQDESNFA